MKGLFANFKGDLFGGITAGIVALTLALAFGVSSGIGPSAGPYGAIFISFLAALFGGTNTQISGPTAPMTAVSMVVIAGIIRIYDGRGESSAGDINHISFGRIDADGSWTVWVLENISDISPIRWYQDL